MVAGELSDVESEDEGNIQTGKRKRASVSAEKHPDPSDAGSTRPKKKRRTIEELATNWGMSLEEAKALLAEHVAALKNIAIETTDVEVVKDIAAEEGGEATQLESLQQFEAAAAKKRKLSNVLDRMDAKRFANVQQKRFNPDHVIRVRCTKPKQEKILALHITRAGPVQQYTEVIFANELPK